MSKNIVIVLLIVISLFLTVQYISIRSLDAEYGFQQNLHTINSNIRENPDNMMLRHRINELDAELDANIEHFKSIVKHEYKLNTRDLENIKNIKNNKKFDQNNNNNNNNNIKNNNKNDQNNNIKIEYNHHKSNNVEKEYNENKNINIKSNQEIIKNKRVNPEHNKHIKKIDKSIENNWKYDEIENYGIKNDKVDNHLILTLDDEEFRKTPVNELMSHYGEAKGPNCDGDFGQKLVNRWRNTKKTYCKPISNMNSTIDCYLVHQTKHHGSGDNLCHLKNIAMNFGQINDKNTKDTMRKYISSRQNDQAYIHFKSGLVNGECQKEKTYESRHFPGWNVDIMWNGLKTHNPNDIKCDIWEESPTLIIQRDTFANFYHDSEDFINAFLTLAILKWNTDDLQILLTDLYPDGPFWDMWTHVYSNINNNEQPLMAWDIKNKYGDKNVCFKNLAVGIYGPAAPIGVISWNTPCSHTPLIRAYSDYVIRGLGLQHKTHYAKPEPPKTITVSYMARRASVIWPERNFCGEDSYFKCEDWTHLSTRKLGRMIQNDQDLVKKLKELENDTFKNGVKVEFRDMDYNVLTFRQQIENDVETDVIVGPHGAGLTHVIFPSDRAHLIELYVDSSQNNRHFYNIASWYGRNHVNKPMKNPVPLQEVYDMVKNAIESINPDEY